jgi:hypothetical protein
MSPDVINEASRVLLRCVGNWLSILTSINYLTIGGGFVELLGGTPIANARASEDSSPKINEFLAKALPLEQELR